MAKDTQPVEITGKMVEKDANEDTIQRVHEASPWAYDHSSGTYRAQLIRKYEVHQILNEYNLAAGATFIHNSLLECGIFKHARVYVKCTGPGNVDVMLRASLNGLDSEVIQTANLEAGKTTLITEPVLLVAQSVKLAVKNNDAAAIQKLSAWLVLQS